MPRKPKYTREEVLASAFEVARKQGIEAVTAASVAANMNYAGSSLFTHFESMEEIKQEVYLLAKQKALSFFEGSIDYFPAFKELGMRWIRFAKEEPYLYRIIFAVTHTDNVAKEFEEVFGPIRLEVKKTFNISEDDANRLMSGCITQANGLALAIINGLDEDYTEERMSEELSNICIGMALLFKAKDGSLTIEMAKKMAAATANIPVHK